jgi:tetratricopeptide (TPR) repeat protein
VADYSRAIHAMPDDLALWFNRLSLRLQAGDLAGYRDDCAGLLERFGSTVDPNVAIALARVCARVPDAVADLTKPVRLAEMAVANAPSDVNLRALGAILYRAGRYEQSIQRLGEATKAHPSGGAAYEWLFLTMSHHRLGHSDEAQRWLEKAVEWIELAEQGKLQDSSTPTPLSPADRLIFQMLRREAEALIKSTTP